MRQPTRGHGRNGVASTCIDLQRWDLLRPDLESTLLTLRLQVGASRRREIQLGGSGNRAVGIRQRVADDAR